MSKFLKVIQFKKIKNYLKMAYVACLQWHNLTILNDKSMTTFFQI